MIPRRAADAAIRDTAGGSPDCDEDPPARMRFAGRRDHPCKGTINIDNRHSTPDMEAIVDVSVSRSSI
jgi:hypothetical protein